MKSLRCKLAMHCDHIIDSESFERTSHNGLKTYHAKVYVYRCCRCNRDNLTQYIPGANPYWNVRITNYNFKEQKAAYFRNPGSLHQAPQKKIF